MKALPLYQHSPDFQAVGPIRKDNEVTVTFPVHLQLPNQTDDDTKAKLLSLLASKPVYPVLSLETNKYRRDSNNEKHEIFRERLLNALSAQWKGPNIIAQFLKLVKTLESDGCAVFAALIDTTRFTSLITDFTKAMNTSGSEAFLHSFLDLSRHPDFLRNKTYRDAFVHPLLIALIAYVMGGAIRMTDVRGKNTQPISVNAQDNMLHIDNTPFRHEFKVLVGWEKDVPGGPSGQNFTYLPGTHQGNRYIRLDGEGRPWSTENDSIFLTKEAVQKVFAFQQKVYSQSPYVVEVQYPERPITVAFSAGSLVHHRYRTQTGSARSCIIAAFHLVDDNPGSLVRIPEGGSDVGRPGSIFDLVFGYGSGTATSDSEFLALLTEESSDIQQKIEELFDDGSDSTLVDPSSVALKGDAFERWREAVINAPSTTSLKFGRNCFLSTERTRMSQSDLIERLTNTMSYDKHGLLDLRLYEDNREEIRKPARKQIFTLKRETISDRLQQWLPAVIGYKFTASDILEPAALRIKTDLIAKYLSTSATADGGWASEHERRGYGQLHAFSQLLTDLGESIDRCDSVETYISTTLFIFWAVDLTRSSLDWPASRDAWEAGTAVLRSYIATSLLVENVG